MVKWKLLPKKENTTLHKMTLYTIMHYKLVIFNSGLQHYPWLDLSLKCSSITDFLITSWKQALISLSLNVYRCSTIRKLMQIAPSLGWSYTCLLHWMLAHSCFTLISNFCHFFILPTLAPDSLSSSFCLPVKPLWMIIMHTQPHHLQIFVC